MRAVHLFLLTKKIPFTYSKPKGIRLRSQIPKRHFLKDRLSQKGKTQTSLHVRAVRSRATGARHRHRRICESSLLKWKHCWPSTEDGTHGSRPQNWCDFSFFAKCFRNKSESVSETKINFEKMKMFLFRKHLRNESVVETKVKLF